MCSFNQCFPNNDMINAKGIDEQKPFLLRGRRYEGADGVALIC